MKRNCKIISLIALSLLLFSMDLNAAEAKGKRRIGKYIKILQTSKEWQERKAAIFRLRSLKAKEAASSLIKTMAGDPEPKVREAAINALTHLKVYEGIPDLKQALKSDPDPRVRAAAALALRDLKAIEVLPDLKKAIKKEKDKSVRTKLRETLKVLEKERRWAIVKIFLGLLAGLLVLAALHFLMPPRFRKSLIALVTFGGGLFYLVEYLIPQKTFLSNYTTSYGYALMVIGSFALALGIINLLGVHIKKIAKRQPDWYNSAALVLGLLSMIIIGFWDTYGASKLIHKIYNIMFYHMLIPLSSTMFSILAFYMVSAAYRAFRMRTAEAALMTVVGFIVMLGQVPIGKWLTSGLEGTSFSFLQFPLVTNWLLTTFNMAAQRGILFGASVGAIAMSLRYLLSLERGAFFEQKL